MKRWPLILSSVPSSGGLEKHTCAGTADDAMQQAHHCERMGNGSGNGNGNGNSNGNGSGNDGRVGCGPAAACRHPLQHCCQVFEHTSLLRQ
jgi:hypothetical protein